MIEFSGLLSAFHGLDPSFCRKSGPAAQADEKRARQRGLWAESHLVNLTNLPHSQARMCLSPSK